ncbi:MAG: hypothetical protein K0R77_1811 [Chryseobacterium sp.]|nr:hypothetical protein [Chryseobacterium sp.]
MYTIHGNKKTAFSSSLRKLLYSLLTINSDYLLLMSTLTGITKDDAIIFSLSLFASILY